LLSSSKIWLAVLAAAARLVLKHLLLPLQSLQLLLTSPLQLLLHAPGSLLPACCMSPALLLLCWWLLLQLLDSTPQDPPC
jgi:hypothetical protein